MQMVESGDIQLNVGSQASEWWYITVSSGKSSTATGGNAWLK